MENQEVATVLMGEEGEELELRFLKLPLKISYPQGWTFLQDFSACLNSSVQTTKKEEEKKESKEGKKEEEKINYEAFIPLFSDVIAKVIGLYSSDYIVKIINLHSPFIKVWEDDTLKEFEMTFRFNETPELIPLLFVKIIETYYKGFFFKFGKGLMPKGDVGSKMEQFGKSLLKSTGGFGK